MIVALCEYKDNAVLKYEDIHIQFCKTIMPIIMSRYKLMTLD